MNIPSHNAKALETQLRKILSGIEANAGDWPKENNINNEFFLKVSDELNDILKDITKTEKKLSDERKKLKQYIEEIAKPLYKKARDQAYSIYGKKSEKLKDYRFKNL